jgi:phenylacetate-coenzyme A ligase PaaK-like adenylate-forming protein
MAAHETINELKSKIFEVTNQNFVETALQVFRFQYENTMVYKNYIDLLKRDVNSIQQIEDIPFLPISLFKTHIVAINHNAEKIFESSGTTGQITSKHYVSDLNIYEESFFKCFNMFFGNPEDYCILGLLPSYLERNNSSLIYMVKELIQKSNKPESSFYLNEYEQLFKTISELEKRQQPYILFGVTFALLEFSENFPINISYGTIIETGGMKGRGKELTRAELHEILRQRFQTSNISSEYGMTELLSQAYLKQNEKFEAPPWMKILIRDVYNPFQYVAEGQSGAINVVDLANLYSCSFIETADMGKLHNNNSFEVLGRIDNSEIRGCNLLV